MILPDGLGIGEGLPRSNDADMFGLFKSLDMLGLLKDPPMVGLLTYSIGMPPSVGDGATAFPLTARLPGLELRDIVGEGTRPRRGVFVPSPSNVFNLLEFLRKSGVGGPRPNASMPSNDADGFGGDPIDCRRPSARQPRLIR